MCNKEEIEDLGRLPQGYHLYRKHNSAGGWIYYSDECGCISMVWDTCIANESTLLAAMLCERNRKHMVHMIEKGLQPQGSDMETEQMAATGGPFISPALTAELKRLKNE